MHAGLVHASRSQVACSSLLLQRACATHNLRVKAASLPLRLLQVHPLPHQRPGGAAAGCQAWQGRWPGALSIDRPCLYCCCEFSKRTTQLSLGCWLAERGLLLTNLPSMMINDSVVSKKLMTSASQADHRLKQEIFRESFVKISANRHNQRKSSAKISSFLRKQIRICPPNLPDL